MPELFSDRISCFKVVTSGIGRKAPLRNNNFFLATKISSGRTSILLVDTRDRCHDKAEYSVEVFWERKRLEVRAISLSRLDD